MISENDIILKYLKKLNFKKKETFDFENDGAFLRQKNNMDIVVTNDSITETVDFFENDDPESIAQKIMTSNLSDLSSLGASPYAYTLSLSLPKGISNNWLKKFTKKLFFLQKKFNIFLLGGDIGNTKQIHISANFFGYVKKNFIIKRHSPKLGDSIWVTGDLGESYIGLLIKQKKINIKPVLQKHFINKYLYPLPCMIGSSIISFASCAIDISDGFFGDLSKLLNKKLGADLLSSKIPFSKKTKYLIDQNIINSNSLLNAGDDYQLIFTSQKKNDSKIKNIAKINNISVSKVGSIIAKKGIQIKNNIELYEVLGTFTNDNGEIVYVKADKGLYNQINQTIELIDNVTIYDDMENKTSAKFAIIDIDNKKMNFIDEVISVSDTSIIKSNSSVVDEKNNTIVYSGNVRVKVKDR